MMLLRQLPVAVEGADFPIPFQPSGCLSSGRTVSVGCGFI
jgi:hypothetical protein